MRTSLVHAALLAASAAVLAAPPRAAAVDAAAPAAVPTTGAVTVPVPTDDALPTCLVDLRAAQDAAKAGTGPAVPVPLHELKACYTEAVRPAIQAGRSRDAAARVAIRLGTEWTALADRLAGDEELARSKWEARKKMLSVAGNAFWRAEERCAGSRDPTALRDVIEWARVAHSLPMPGPNDVRPVPDLDVVMAASARFELRVRSQVRFAGGAGPLDLRAEAVFPLVPERPRYDLLRGAGAFEVTRAPMAGAAPQPGERRADVPARVTLVLVDAKAPPAGAPAAPGAGPEPREGWAPRPLVTLELEAPAGRDGAAEARRAWPAGFQALHVDAWEQGSSPPRLAVELAPGAPGEEPWARATTRGHLEIDAARPFQAWELDPRFSGTWDGETEWTLVHTPVKLQRGAPAPAAAN